MKKYILSLFCFGSFVFSYAQTITISNGAEVKVEGINNTSQSDAALTIDGNLVIEDGAKLNASRDARFFISGNITYAGNNAISRARSIMTFYGPNDQTITNSSGTNDLTLYDLILQGLQVKVSELLLPED